MLKQYRESNSSCRLLFVNVWWS